MTKIKILKRREDFGMKSYCLVPNLSLQRCHGPDELVSTADEEPKYYYNPIQQHQERFSLPMGRAQHVHCV